MTGEHFSLPRGIRIGDSMEKVRSAYPGLPHAEPETNDGGMRLVYRYPNYDLGYTFSRRKRKKKCLLEEIVL